MRIVCIGGGPAGLTFALLMKKLDPGHDITVVERNRPYDTFGWGVVFSDATMAHLRRWDEETAGAIEAAFAHWDDIVLEFKGRSIRSGGHGFVGIGRKRLLNILQARCESLGVKLEFDREVRADTEFPDADLIVASDGVNSVVRQKYADVFQPDIVTRPNRFIWLGTKKLYDAFTFVFERTEHGWFQAHVYKFDAETSTFIVECPEHVWLAHGLDKLDADASVAFCEQVFARHLQGATLMTNARHLRGSAWLNFQRIKCAQWWVGAERREAGHAPVVLMGDAVHTAHFAIGSGTKLALEDAIELANQFKQAGDTTPTLPRAARSLPGAPRGRGAAPAERRVERDGVVRGLRHALLRSAGARAVHVLAAHAQPAHQPREPAPARRRLARGLRALVRAARRGAATTWSRPTPSAARRRTPRRRSRRCSRRSRCAPSR